MKKLKITILPILLFPCCLLAQIPNADFELWLPADLFDPDEYPQYWVAPPHLGAEFYPIEKVYNPNMGQYALKVKNTMPSPSSVGGAPGDIMTTFMPSSQHFRLSMDVKYDTIVPPGRARIEIKGAGFLYTYWVDEQITEEMETIQLDVELPTAYDALTLRIVALGVYNPDYGTPPFDGGYDGYAEIVVDNIIYENVVSAEEAMVGEVENLFPNPTSGLVHIQLPEGVEAEQMELYNISGALLCQKRNALPAALDLSGLPAGIYQLLVMGSDGKRYWGQVVKK